MRVLLVDDHAELLTLLTTSLERDGHRVVAAGTIEEAWRALETGPFDVIVLDVALPDGSGIELCRRARPERVARRARAAWAGRRAGRGAG